MFVEYVRLLSGDGSSTGIHVNSPVVWIVGAIVVLAILWTLKR